MKKKHALFIHSTKGTQIISNLDFKKKNTKMKFLEKKLRNVFFSGKNQKKNIPVISRKIGRNEVCPTSNKKYKHCYGTENCKFGTVACKLST